MTYVEDVNPLQENTKIPLHYEIFDRIVEGAFYFDFFHILFHCMEKLSSFKEFFYCWKMFYFRYVMHAFVYSFSLMRLLLIYSLEKYGKFANKIKDCN